ncbi:MAG: sensor histidine kinase [Sphaerochaeta sp.]|jgi:two-component system sensor histidine kinase YesM|nr:sensor histidine kinase [Sphaerochaeta sp.]MCI2129007.1 sensor histidine kinase [Sphaerochaeta sp.]
MKDRLARFFNNKPIVWKFIVLVACIDALGCFITGDIYYRYASRTILQNSSDSLSRETAIVGDYLQEKGSMLLTSLFSLVTNNTLQNSVSQYCSAPTGENTTRLVAELNDDLKQTTFINGGFLRGVVMFINNQMFYDFSLARKKPVDFSSTDLYQTFQHQSKGYYLGFPAMEDPFFIKNGNVIPIVFRYEMHEQEVYVVALVEQSYLTSYLESYRDLTFFIANGDGSPVIPWGSVFDGVVGKRVNGSGDVSTEKLNGERYLVSNTTIPALDWHVVAFQSTQAMVEKQRGLMLFVIVILGLINAVGLAVVIAMSRTITRPLNQLVALMEKPTEERFSSSFEYPYSNEIGKLSSRYNTMMEEIKDLVAQLNEKIEDLKEEEARVQWEEKQRERAEFNALQAQINPHFLYNTLNSISWLAMEHKSEEAAMLATSLGRFYQISLSNGREFITVGEELDHVMHYLTIQGNRFKDVLSSAIQVPEEMKAYSILKILLQPLVENAITHGIKPLGRQGHVVVAGSEMNDQLEFRVMDDGVGISAEQLEVINAHLEAGLADGSQGYGMFNVNARIKLTYGSAFGVRLESTVGAGTIAIVRIPKRSPQEEVR